MSVLYIIDINLVVSLCTDYTPGGELVNWKWSHSGGEIGNLLGTWRGKVEGHVGAPSNCLHSTKGIYAQKHLYHQTVPCGNLDSTLVDLEFLLSPPNWGQTFKNALVQSRRGPCMP